MLTGRKLGILVRFYIPILIYINITVYCFIYGAGLKLITLFMSKKLFFTYTKTYHKREY